MKELAMKLENVAFRNVGTCESPDTETVNLSGYGCPCCNKNRQANRLETQASGLFWCRCCGTLWELFDKTTEKIGRKKKHCRNCYWAARDLKRHLVCVKYHGDIQINHKPCKKFIWETKNQVVIERKAALLEKFNENYSNGIYG